MKTVQKARKYYAIALLSLISLGLNVYAAKALIIFGSPILFAAALLLELFLAILFVYCIVRTLTVPKNIVLSLVYSVRGGLATNDYVKKFSASRSPTIVWIRRRFYTGSPYGLLLTITLFVALIFFVNFLSVLINITTKGSLTHIDVRILNLIPSIRTPTQTTFFSIVTTLANTETAILLLVAIAAVLWRKKQRLLTVFVLLVGGGEESVTYVIKHIVKRLRPEQALSLIREDSYSFPSGHVVRATVLLGLLAYLLVKTYATTRAKIITIGLYIFTVFLVAISRVYLGVHYPSDVWGSALLGSALLTAVIGILEAMSRYEIINNKKMILSNKTLVFVPAILIVFATIAAPFLVRVQPILIIPASVPVQKVDSSTIQRLPLYSETLMGSRMEPISFVYIGYENQIESTFEKHGWYKADPSTVNNTLKALAVGFQDRQYLTAPVTPSYLNSQPENVAFEQSTATHSLRQRHHTRIWRTEYAAPDRRPIWVATASFDEGIEFGGTAKLPTHHIDPNIDGERTYITKSLGLHSNLVDVVQPQLGKNAGGDGFFTDGKAELVSLP